MSSEIAELLARVAAENEINCTGLGEVGCRGRKGWHSWHEHRKHVAESQADALADLLAARDRRVRSVAEDIAYEHAATIDGEFGCCHDEAELRAGGRAPAFDGDEFDPLPEDCDGKRILDRHLAAIHAASEADQ